MLKSCCEWFESSLGLAGEKGYSVIAFKGEKKRCFYLQARPFERDVTEKYNSIEKKTGKNKWPKLFDNRDLPVPYVIAINIPLEYCPSCGANLSKKIRRNQKEFDSIASKMEKYIK